MLSYSESLRMLKIKLQQRIAQACLKRKMSSVEFSCGNYSVFANDRQIKSEIVILLFLVGFFENFSFLKKIKKIANLLDIFFSNLYIINHFAAVAQLVEQWTENPCVVGPIPTGGKSPNLKD